MHLRRVCGTANIERLDRPSSCRRCQGSPQRDSCDSLPTLPPVQGAAATLALPTSVAEPLRHVIGSAQTAAKIRFRLLTIGSDPGPSGTT